MAKKKETYPKKSLLLNMPSEIYEHLKLVARGERKTVTAKLVEIIRENLKDK